MFLKFDYQIVFLPSLFDVTQKKEKFSSLHICDKIVIIEMENFKQITADVQLAKEH